MLCIQAQGRPLDEIRRSGVVRVAFTQSGMRTVNVLFAKEFAKFLNCELDTVIITWNDTFSQNGVVPADYMTNDSVRYTPDALRKADLICGTTYMYPWREKFFDFAGIMQVSDLLIVNKMRQRRSVIGNLFVPEELRPKGHKLNVKNYYDLKGLRIAIMGNSSYEANLAKINEMIGGGIEIVKTKSEEESQELAKIGEVDGFVTISYVGLQFVNRNNDKFKLAFPIAKPDNVAWAVEKGNSSLKVEIDNFFHTIKGSGLLDKHFIFSFGYDYASYGDIINSYSDATINSDGNFRDMDEIIESGKLIVALRDRDLVYHPSGQKQLNHYLAGELAKYLGLDLEIKIVPSLSSYFYDNHGNIVKDSVYTPETFNHIDIACDLLSPVDWRKNKIDIINVMPTADVVIARKDVDIKSINDLSKLKGVTSKGSIYEEDLIGNNISNYYYKEANEFFTEIIKGRADYTITNFDIYSLPQYPELEAKFVIGDIYSVGWGIRKNQPKLRQKILEFLESSKKLLGIFNNAFLEQAGIPYNAAQNHIQAMYQTYQTGYFPFVFYGSDQGLPQEDVRCIFQDKEGYIWIGTQSGAIKFNGREMESYDEELGLGNNIVFDIAQDSKGRMYFATLDGLTCIDENGELTNYLNNVPIKHIYINRKDNKYLYGDKGLYHLSSNNSKQQSMDSKVEGLPTIINSLYQNKSGRYTFIASPSGFYTLDRDDNKLTRLCDKNCYSVFVEDDGMIWMSASDGVYNGNVSQFSRGNIDSLRINDRVSIGNSRIHTIKQNHDESILLISDFEVYQIFSTKQSAIKYDQSIGLKNLKLLCFFEDKEDNFWFGYRGGIQKLTNRSLRNLYPEVIDSYLNNIIEDNNGRIWMAFNNKILYFQNHLVDFSPNLDGYNVPYVVNATPSGDIFIADSYGMYVYDCKLLTKKQELKFQNRIYNLKSAYASNNGDVFLLTGAEGVVYKISGGFGQPEPIVNEYTSFVSQMEEFNGMIVGGNNTGLVKYNGSTFEEICPTPSAVLSLRDYDGKLWVGTEYGLGIYTTDGKFRMIDIPMMHNVPVNSIRPARSDKDHIWLGTNKGFSYYSINSNNVEFSVYSNDGLPGNEVVTDGLLMNNKGVLYIATYHGVSIYDLRKEASSKFVPECRLENLLMNGSKISQQRNVFSSSENNFTFELAGLSFKDEESITYEFFMKGLENDFVASSGKEHKAVYQNLPAGKYEFVYRAKSKDNIWSNSQTYRFVIRKPFYATWWFITLMVLGTIICIIILFKIRERRLRERNEQLENTVRERTAEIQKQKDDIELKNEELEAQREEIMAQRNLATQQRDEIAQREKEIMDSIYYAKRIQTAIMPTANEINSVLENFILFRPRDIVSGDFYYFKQIGSYAVIVAADCTGHGVPGACMSMLGSAYINEIVTSHQDALNSGEILDLLRESVIESLNQTGRVDEAKDGMDIALCILNLDTRELQFSGAFNPMYVVRNGEIDEYQADRMPIGIHDNVNVNFGCHNVQMQKDDIVYIFSDGYASQFGGKHGRKIMTTRFKKLLQEISGEPISEQGKILNDKIEKWMGVDYDQVDDILVMGFKVK